MHRVAQAPISDYTALPSTPPTGLIESMRTRLNLLHKTVGIITVLVFLGTGLRSSYWSERCLTCSARPVPAGPSEAQVRVA
jgi:hypothetical protein